MLGISFAEEKITNKLSYKDERELGLLLEKMEKLTQVIKELELELNDPNLYANDQDKFNALSNKIGNKREELENAEIRWLELEELKQVYGG